MTTHSARFYTLIATIYVFNGRKFLSMSYSDILLNWNLVVQQSAVVVPFAKHSSGFGLCDKVRQGLFIHALVSGLISTFLPASVISPNRSSRLTRSLFNSVQGLFRFLGVKHCILLPSISLCRLSIHPLLHGIKIPEMLVIYRSSPFHVNPAFSFAGVVGFEPCTELTSVGYTEDVMLFNKFRFRCYSFLYCLQRYKSSIY